MACQDTCEGRQVEDLLLEQRDVVVRKEPVVVSSCLQS